MCVVCVSVVWLRVSLFVCLIGSLLLLLFGCSVAVWLHVWLFLFVWLFGCVLDCVLALVVW